jgi:hypothetical protein
MNSEQGDGHSFRIPFLVPGDRQGKQSFVIGISSFSMQGATDVLTAHKLLSNVSDWLGIAPKAYYCSYDG